jgi:hypothetical protein
MAELHIRVGAPAMPISTEFVRFCKALEHFYYVIVLTEQPGTNAAAAWNAWLAAGLNPAVRLAPPVDQADRIKVDSRPGVGGFDVTLRGTNAEVLGRLHTLLAVLDTARKSISGRTDESVRLAALRESSAVAETLVQPLKGSLAHSQIPAEEVKSFLAMIDRDLLALSAADITSIDIEAR